MGFSISLENSETRGITSTQIADIVAKEIKGLSTAKAAIPSTLPQPKGMTLAEAKAHRQAMNEGLSQFKLEQMQDREAKKRTAYYAKVKAENAALREDARKLAREKRYSKYQTDFSGMLSY